MSLQGELSRASPGGRVKTKEERMKKRSVRISGHPTSVSLEEEFWGALKSIADSKTVSINQLITDIDETRGERNLSSAIRVFVLTHLSEYPLFMK